MVIEDYDFLNQMIESLEEVIPNLEEFYNKKDYEKFNKTKKFILEIQKRILEGVE
jgi:hypothetical protein